MDGLGRYSRWNCGEKLWRFFAIARSLTSPLQVAAADTPHTKIMDPFLGRNGREVPDQTDQKPVAPGGKETPQQIHPSAIAMPFTEESVAMESAAMSINATSAMGVTGPCIVLEDHPLIGTKSKAPPRNDIPTPVKASELCDLLQDFDSDEREFLVNGFMVGFKVPFEGTVAVTEARNLVSAHQYPSIVTKKLDKEVQEGRIAGPFAQKPFPNLVISPIGLVPKKAQGEFRLIHHLSHPKDFSVNSGIARTATAVTYHTVDNAIQILCEMPPGAYLAKTDIKNAFRIVPVNPESYHLLGIKWNDQYFYDKTLAMGLSASCQIFERFSSALQWVSQYIGGVQHMLHILDDFLFINQDHQSCQNDLNSFMQICHRLGVPLAGEKTEGPSTTLTFAGIELDSVDREARLPQEKLLRYRQTIHQFIHRKKVTLRELQSIIGALHHCSYIIPAGRAFLRRLINLSRGISKPLHHIRLNKAARLDLAMWDTFLQRFNGRTLFLDTEWIHPSTLHLYTDAAQSLGYGAVFQEKWFYGQWPDIWKQYEITFLELFPIVLALNLWGQQLSCKRIVLHTDNQALCFIINKFSSKDDNIMVLLRNLASVCLDYNVLIKAEHIPGVLNTLADSLSRFKFQDFRRLAPWARSSPEDIPQNLLPANWSLT